MKTQSFGYSLALGSFPLDVCLSRTALGVAAQKGYRDKRENGDERDSPKRAFPSAGFDALHVPSSTYKPDGPRKGVFGKKEDYWPDKQARYWWRLTLENGVITEDYYWMTDDARGFPDASDNYWFSVHHAPSGTKMEGFSARPDKVKGYLDKDGDYWCYIRYDECGPIKEWMEEKDRNYVARLQREQEPEQSKVAAPGEVREAGTQALLKKDGTEAKLSQSFGALSPPPLASTPKLPEKSQEELSIGLIETKAPKMKLTTSSSASVLKAVSSKNQILFKKLKENPSTNWKELDENRNNIFHLAAGHGNSKIFSTLLSSVPGQMQGPLLRQANEKDETPLHLAARFGYTDVIEPILKAIGSNLSRTLKVYDEQGYLPLHEAVVSGELKVTQALMDAGADMNALTEDGLNIQQLAIKNGHTLLAKSLDLILNPPSAVPTIIETPSFSSEEIAGNALEALALQQYTPQSHEELFVSSGESILILAQNEDGWWFCRNSRGQDGYLPMQILNCASSNSPKIALNHDEKINSAEARRYSSGSFSSSSPPISLSSGEMDRSRGSRGSLSFSGKSGSSLKTGIDSAGLGVVDLVIPYSEVTLGKELGKGGFGVVYRGERHGEDVAVKRLLCQTMDEATKQEFMNEAGIMLRLQHGNIVRLYGISLEPYAMVMEFLEKSSLDRLLYSEEPLDFVTRYKIALDIANGLSFLHSREMVHCDLKSLNVLLDDRYKAKLADFGMSKVRTSTQSFSGARAGTPFWTAPEILDGDKYAKSADVYSYGIILWEILARRIPFSSTGGKMSSFMAFVIQGKREPIPVNSPEVLARLTAECWAQAPEQRPTMPEVVRSLKESPVTEGVPPTQMRGNFSGAAAYGLGSGPGRGYGSPVISGRGGGRVGSGIFPPSQPSATSSLGGAYGVDSGPGPGRGRGYDSPVMSGRGRGRAGSGIFHPSQPSATSSLGGAYGVDSGSGRGRVRGLPQTPPVGRSGSGFFAPSQPSASPAPGGAYGIDSTRPSRARGLPKTPDANASRPSSGYGRGGYG